MRSADLERQVSPAQPQALAHILVANIDPADERHSVVHQENLTMVANEVANEKREEANIDLNRTSNILQLCCDCASTARRAPAVYHDLYRDTSLGRLPQRLDKARTYP